MGIDNGLHNLAMLLALLAIVVGLVALGVTLRRCADALEDQSTPRMKEKLRVTTGERDKLEHDYKRIQKKYTARCDALSDLTKEMAGLKGNEGGGSDSSIGETDDQEQPE